MDCHICGNGWTNFVEILQKNCLEQEDSPQEVARQNVIQGVLNISHPWQINAQE